MDVHLRDLRYFATVARELHFTRAAERLYVSQPALSKQIRALERQLGEPLFIRDRRDVTLTDAGRLLLEHVERVMGEWDAATAALAQRRAAETATLTVGMSTGPGRSGLMPAVRSRFSAAAPGVTLHLRQSDWADSTAGLAEGVCDVAFVWLAVVDAERYRWIVVAEEPRVVAMAETHPLAAQAELSVTDLRDVPMLALPEEAGRLRDHWLLTEFLDAPPSVGAVVHTVDETYEALVDCRGVVVLASGNAPLLTRGGVVTRALRGVPASVLALAWRADDARPAVAAYVEACAQVVRHRAVDNPT